MYDVLVKNGRIVTADRVSEGNIAIRDGKIAAVLNAGEEPEAAKVIDAKGNYVFPGAIDTHAHLNDPGWEAYPMQPASWEDVYLSEHFPWEQPSLEH